MLNNNRKLVVNELVLNNGRYEIDFNDFEEKIIKENVKKMRKNEKRHLLNEITEYFRSIGCHRDSIWTFAQSRTHKYSSMTRDNFIGFGCSATSLLKDQFKINTFSVEEYCKRIDPVFKTK